MTVLPRRAFLQGGALMVGFALAPAWAQEPAGEGSGATGVNTRLAGSLKKTPMLDSWIRIDRSGAVTVCTGKAELGQGIRTALAQVAAEELDLPLAAIRMQTADTDLTPDEGYTAGSHSMQDSGSAIRAAAAEVRAILMAEAARRGGTTRDALRTEDGAVVMPGGGKVTYGTLSRASCCMSRPRLRRR